MSEKKQRCVLLATELMGIGGAETHIYELSRALIKLNWKVVLVSSGGILADKLVEFGVIKYDVPLRSKNVKSLIPAYRRIIEIIRKEKPEVLHSHSRIPAVLLYRASKKFMIPFVTTDHARFSNTNLLMRFMTRWGDKTLAVSDDLKKYLLENYSNVKEQNIYLTINGIDTDTFKNRSEEKPFRDEIYEELGITTDKKIILSVSRLDKTAYLCVFELLSIAEKLHQTIPDSRIVIVGGGDVFEDVAKKVLEINRRIGENYIILTGPRSDIYRLCGVCTCFVGCARSAIEAASCEKPVLIAGNGGYAGLLNNETLDFCLSSNFTARGITEFPLDKLLNDIKYATTQFEETKSFRNEMRDLICERYSVEKMAKDAIDIYYKAICVRGEYYDCTLTGYYGHGNLGDDSLLLTIIHNLRERIPDLRICVLCHVSSNLSKYLKNQNVIIKSRFNPLSVVFSLKKSKSLIFGGGTLLQDNTSTKSLLYYLTLIKIATHFHSKIMLYGNGIGPILRKVNEKRVKAALELCDILTLRDKESLTTIAEMKIQNPKIHLAADEVLTYQLPGQVYIDQVIKNHGLEDEKYVVISVRKWRKAPFGFYDNLIAALTMFCEKTKLIPVFTVMEITHDEQITQHIASKLPGGRIIHYSSEPSEIVAITSRADYVISMRLHTLVFAALAGIPMLGIAYDPKVENFLVSVGCKENCIDISEFDTNRFVDLAIARYHTENNDKEKQRQLVDIEIVRAKQNAEIATQFLNDIP